MKNLLFVLCLILGFGCTNAQQQPTPPKSPLEIKEDKGIIAKLPPWSDEAPDLNSFDKRNVLSVAVNKKNELLVRDKKMDVDDLKSMVKEFIANPDKDALYAEKPTNAIVSLRNDKGTDYKIYLNVYNEIKAAYNELWDEQALHKFGKTFNELTAAQQREVKAIIPMVLSEAEPTDF